MTSQEDWMSPEPWTLELDRLGDYLLCNHGQVCQSLTSLSQSCRT